METPMLVRAVLIMLLAAGSFTIGHGARLLMRRMRLLPWVAGVCFGFVAFLTNRLALTATAWLIYTALFGQAPDPLVLLALVGLASVPLLLSFAHVTPFFGPGVLFILYIVALIRLTSLTSLSLDMDWLGCLGWWTAASLVTSGAGYALRRVTRDIKWLGWTGILGQARATPREIMAGLPGLRLARGSSGRAVGPSQQD